MPVIGLTDLDGAKWTFKQIEGGAGNFADPLPVLMSLFWPRRTYAEVTASMLPGDLRQAILKSRTDYYEDPADLQQAMFGTGLHMLMTKAGTENTLSEERLTAMVEGVKVGGIPDLYLADGSLVDYKTVGAWVAGRIMAGDKDKIEEWQGQLTVYQFLLEKCGFPVKRKLIRGFVRDWRNQEQVTHDELLARYEMGDVYKTGVRKGLPVEKPKWYGKGFRIELELGTVEEAETYVTARVREYKRLIALPESEWPLCDCWERDEKRTRCISYCGVNFACSLYRTWAGLDKKGE